MVEMVETAAILNQATARSLVILDEIGRGTATFDGLSIAWAAIEHLHEANRCRALFATHFHELTALADRLARIANATLKVTEWNGEVVFLHEVVPGAADRSYGLAGGAARRSSGAGRGAGEDDSERAGEVGSGEPEARARRRPAAICGSRPHASGAGPAGCLAGGAREIDPDQMTPREALDALYRLKSDASG